MLERSDLVPFLASTPAATLPRRGGSVLALPSGDVAAQLRCIGATRLRASYELTIVNDSAETVAAYTHAPPEPAGARVWQGALVPAYSSVTVCVDVAKARHAGSEPVVAELRAAGTRLTIGAPPRREAPPAGAGHFARTLAVAALVIATLGLGVAHGNIIDGAIGSPSPATARHPKNLLAAPPRRARAATPRRLVATRPAVPPLRVADLVVPGSVRSGQSVRIDYQTVGTDGTVALVDESGRTVARTVLDPRGSSVLLAPSVDAAQDFVVVVAARRDGERAQAVAPLFVRPAERRPQPQVRASAAPSPPPATIAARAPEDEVVDAAVVSAPIVVAGVQSVGRPIVVRVLAHPRDLHLSLFAAGGTPLAERDVPSDAGSVVFPALAKARDLSLITTYAHGPGEESTISPIRVR